MNEELWSLEGIKDAMKRDLNKDPLDIAREKQERRLAQEKADRITDNIPYQLREKREFLWENIPEASIDKRIDDRRKAEGIAENMQPELDAAQARARVNARSEMTEEILKEVFGQRTMDRHYGYTPEGDWKRHVDSLKLNLRDRVNYEAESKGTRLTPEKLDEEEALQNIRNISTDGIRGPSDDEIKRLIEMAKKNGHWPLPKLHPGPNAYSDFQKFCARTAGHDNSNGHTGNSPANKLPATPEAPPPHRGRLRKLQARQEPALADIKQREQPRVNDHEEGRLPQLERQRFRDLFKALLKNVSQKIMGREEQKPSPGMRAAAASTTAPVARVHQKQEVYRGNSSSAREISPLEIAKAVSTRRAMIENRDRVERERSPLSL
jgi:hypothetical protein